MSEQPAAQPPAAPAKPGEPGFFTRLEDKILPKAEADAAKVAASLASALQDRSGEALDVAGDFLALVKLIDPADAPLATAAQALLPKMIAMAENALKDIRAALPAA